VSQETWTLEYDSGQRAITFNRANPEIAFASTSTASSSGKRVVKEGVLQQ
jgi:hypothetical protein